ncbi:KIN4A [Scenedesmus sp. PABB004]|nr:KIN4A [Scenedesmus sp. PABB004]
MLPAALLPAALLARAAPLALAAAQRAFAASAPGRAAASRSRSRARPADAGAGSGGAAPTAAAAEPAGGAAPRSGGRRSSSAAGRSSAAATAAVAQPAAQPAGEGAARLASLNEAMQRLNKKLGSGTVMRLGQHPAGAALECISSGCSTLDIALGGGWPRGRIVEVFGPESSGKSSLALHAIAEAQKAGGQAVLVDAEHAFNRDFARKLGVHVDDLVVCQPSCGEEALEVVDTLLRSRAVALIAVDSVAALVPRAEQEGDMGMAQVAGQARMMSQGLRKLAGTAAKTNTCLLFVNQLRHKVPAPPPGGAARRRARPRAETTSAALSAERLSAAAAAAPRQVGVLFGNPETTSGGNALKYYASVRVDVRVRERVKGPDKAEVGVRVRAKVVKNKVAPPYRSAEFTINFQRGIDGAATLLEAGELLGFVDSKGSHFYLDGAKLGHGRDAAAAALERDAPARERLAAAQPGLPRLLELLPLLRGVCGSGAALASGQQRPQRQQQQRGEPSLPAQWAEGWIRLPPVPQDDATTATAFSWARRQAPALAGQLDRLFRQRAVRLLQGGRVKRVSRGRPLAPGDVLLLPELGGARAAPGGGDGGLHRQRAAAPDAERWGQAPPPGAGDGPEVPGVVELPQLDPPVLEQQPEPAPARPRRGPAPPRELTPAQVRRWVLASSEAIAVLHKPPGVALHVGEGRARTLSPAIAAGLRVEAPERPALVCGLEPQASGAVVLARHAAAAEWLSAWVAGEPAALAAAASALSGAADGGRARPGARGRQQQQKLARLAAAAAGARGRDGGGAAAAAPSFSAKQLAPWLQLYEGMQGLRLRRVFWCVVSGELPRRQAGTLRNRMLRGDLQLPALTRYRVLASGGGLSWLELLPLTNRPHQLRLHCAKLLGTPVVGDFKFGYRPAAGTAADGAVPLPERGRGAVRGGFASPGAGAAWGAALAADGGGEDQPELLAADPAAGERGGGSGDGAAAPLLLHCREVVLLRPRQRPVTVVAPLPREMRTLLHEMGWNSPPGSAAAPGAPQTAKMGFYSIAKHFEGATVLLTGSSGYVGGLVLERLVRSTDVERVYVLMRPKRGEDIGSRLRKQLHESAIFHLLRGNPVLDKVVPIAGNMLATDLGISLEDRRRLAREVTDVIHCAADIRLEAGIKDLLQANYEGTRQLCKLACGFANLSAFVHVSSAYTNMNAPTGSLVKEAIYPLTHGDQLVDDYELVQELLSMPAHNANLRAEGLMKAWNFPNNYTLSKHLAEYMVADYHKHAKLPVCICRPTLISSVARDPYPGYTGNYAGHVGATLAFMAGLFDSPEASNYKGGNVWDVIPADVVVSDILAAAAALGAGMAAACTATQTCAGRLLGSAYCDAEATRAAAAAGGARGGAGGKPGARGGGGGGGAAPISVTAFAGARDADAGAGRRDQAAPAGAAATGAGAGGAGEAEEEPLLIIHCGSSTLYPLTIMESWNWGVEAYGAWVTGWRLCRGCAAPLTAEHEPNPAKAAKLVAWTGWKVWAVAGLLRLFGEEKVAKKLSVGFDSFRVINQPKTDVNLRFSTCNMQRLAAKLDPAERDEFLLLWRPQLGGAAAAAPRVADGAGAGAKAGGAHGAHDLLPPVGGGGVIRAKLGGSRESSCCSDGEDSSSSCSSASSGGGRAPASQAAAAAPQQPARGAALGPEQRAALAKMRAVPAQWRDFHINLGAFLYCSVFRMPEPEPLLPINKEQVLHWLDIKPEDAWGAWAMADDDWDDEDLLEVTGHRSSKGAAGKKRGRKASDSEDDFEASPPGRGAAPPAKQRRGAAESDGEGSDAVDEEEERKLAAMNELEREMYLFEREEILQRQRERKAVLKQARNEAEQVEVRASTRRPRGQTGTDSAIGRIAAAHAQREKRKQQAAEQAQRRRAREASEEEEAEAEEEPSERGATEEGDEEEAELAELAEDDDAGALAARAERYDEGAGSYEESEERASLEEVRSITLRRADLEAWHAEPFFEEDVRGCLLRVVHTAEQARTGFPAYMLARVADVVQRNSYAFPAGAKNSRTRKWLHLDDLSGNGVFRHQMVLVSNSAVTEAEYEKALARASRGRGRFITKGDVAAAQERLQHARTFKYHPELVKQLLERKRAAGKVAGSAAQHRARLAHEINVARQDGRSEDEIARLQDELDRLESQDAARAAEAQELIAAAVGDRDGERGGAAGGAARLPTDMALAVINLRNRDRNNLKIIHNLAGAAAKAAGGDEGSKKDVFSRRHTTSKVYWATGRGGGGGAAAAVAAPAAPLARQGSGVADVAVLKGSLKKLEPAELIKHLDLELDLSRLPTGQPAALLPKRLLGPRWMQSGFAMTAAAGDGGPGTPRPARPSTLCAAARGARDEDAGACAVRVAVHIRPLVEQELAKGCQEILDVAPGSAQARERARACSGAARGRAPQRGGGHGPLPAPACRRACRPARRAAAAPQITVPPHTFAYDNVYGAGGGAHAGALYPDCVQPLVAGLFRGYNATVFAYGQTGSGKTFTMGSSWSPDDRGGGVIPSVMDELFARIDEARDTEFTVKVSFVEIHKEEVRDLLWTSSAAPRPVVTIRELPSGVSLAGASERLVRCREEMGHVLMQGTLMRAVASTNMNNRGEQARLLGQGDERCARAPAAAGLAAAAAQMHLVDLAGSERAKRTGAQGARLKEAININKGLLALAKVITALVDGQSHVPYRRARPAARRRPRRDSKLTRLLQDSLGGNSRTVMIACVSPADINREESLNTLRYADRARRIKNKPVVNRDPVAAQLAALRQQVAGLRAENGALKAALGGEPGAAAAFAAAAAAGGRGGGGGRGAREALQEAYDDLAVRCNALEVQNARQAMELALLRLEVLQRALAASADEAVRAALRQDAAAVAAAARAAEAGDGGDATSPGAGGDAPADCGEGAEPPPPPGGELGVVAGLRARVSELECELRQVRSLQRMTSHALARGMGSAGGAPRGGRPGGARARGGAARPGGAPGGARGGASPGGSPALRLEEEEGLSIEDEDADACSPLTPARPAADDELDEPLMESEPDAEVLAQSAAHMVAREAMALKLAALGRQMEAKQKRLLALQSAADKLQAVEAAGAEERKRLEATYRDKLTSVERRLKELAEREKAAKRGAAQLGRVQSVCQQLQADISRMKAARAAVQRRMEAKEKEFREWRLAREREVLQLRRNAQRQDAALQQHQAMHCKQQAVLKRKTEEAEAARRKLRDLMELQARVRRDKRAAAGASADQGAAPPELELQPNATAPLLRTEKARREWVDQELELCSTSWQYQKVLEGELAQRAEATRRLREVQKQLMLLGGLVPPSPVVTAAAAAAAAASRGAGAGAGATALPREEVLQQDAARLQAAIEQHSANVKELQEQWERARSDEQSRGAGAADVKRWTGIRNIVEARELLRTLFLCACAQKAQVCEGAMELAKLQEAADILQIRLDMALQQAAEAKRKALEAEATTAAVISTPGHRLALAAAAAAAGGDASEGEPDGAGDGGGDGEGGAAAAAASRRRRAMQRLVLRQESAERAAAAAAAIAAAAAASRREFSAAGVADLLGQLGSAAAASPGGPGGAGEDVRDDVDIEADALLHSMGLPPIMELPSEELGTPGSAGGGRYAPPGRRLAGAAGSGSGAWRSGSGSGPPEPGGGGGGRGGGGARPERSASLGSSAHDLAAKLDALQVDWQGYKRGAAAGSGVRRSIPGSQPGGRASTSSLPGSPGAGGGPRGGSFALSTRQPGSAAGERGGAGDAAATPGGAARRPAPQAFWPHQAGPGGDEEAVGSAGTALPPDDDGDAERVAGVAKELNFLDVDAERSPAAPPRGGRAARRGRGGAGGVPGGRAEEEDDEELDIGEDDEAGDSEDDESADPSYDPAASPDATPAGAHAGGQRGRAARGAARHSRLSAGSLDDAEPAGPPTAVASARVSGRWGAGQHPGSGGRAAAAGAAPHSGGAAPAASARSLTAQVSWNHEKRRGWERPVLDDINARRSAAGLPTVDKLTIRLLKEAMTGQEVDGRPWAAGAKTKDNLIADYRRMLHLNEAVDEETDIDRITGAATWSMPPSPASSDGEAGDGGGAAPGARGRPGGRAAASVRRSSSMGVAGGGPGAARRVASASMHLDVHACASAPPSASPSPGRCAERSLGRGLLGVGSASKFRPGSSPPGGGALAGGGGRRLVSQSVDGGLAGAERVPRDSPAGALQQAAQRSSCQLKLSIPSSRVDGPYSARVPSSSGGGEARPAAQQLSSGERGRGGQPTWR